MSAETLLLTILLLPLAGAAGIIITRQPLMSERRSRC